MPDSQAAARTPVIALVGNPNTGKTTLFNALTGLSQKVANYAGVTVEKKEGTCHDQHGKPMRVLDLPGAYSLSARTPDEVIPRDVLLGRRAGETLEIVRAVHLENAAAPSEADRFCISPREHARLDLWAKSAGMAVVGVWHSHPSGPGWPSRADRAGGVEGWSHLIAAPGEGSFLELRSWRMVGGEFLEELLLSR